MTRISTKWRIAAALCGVAIAATAVACGSGGEGEADETPTASASRTAAAPSPTTAAPAPAATATAGDATAPATAPSVAPTSAPGVTQAPAPSATPAPQPTTAPPPPPPPPPPPGEVRISVVAKDVKFVPGSLSAPAGSTIIIAFDNQDAGVIHDIVFFAPGGGELAASELITGPATATITFTASAPGSYPFKCSVHPQQMRGVLNAQ